MKNKKLLTFTAGILVLSILSNPVSELFANSDTGSNSANLEQDIPNDLTFGTSINTDLEVASLVDGKQNLRTRQENFNYANIVVQKDVPLQWIIEADQDISRSCISYVVLPNLGMEGVLKEGENLIEFTPTETGTFEYYCGMKMYFGTITVVDDINNFDESLIQSEISNIVPANGGSGCCSIE